MNNYLIYYVDYLEYSILVTIIYISLHWIQRRNKRLFRFMYGYSALLTVSYIVHLPTLYTLLIIGLPTLGICALLNFDEHPLPSHTSRIKDWVPIVIRLCIQTMYHKKNMYVIIEQATALHELLHSPYIYNVMLEEPLLATILQTHSYDYARMLWLTHQGILYGVNTWWHDLQQKPDPDIWHHKAQLLSTSTDALCIATHYQSHTFTLIQHGAIITHIKPHQIISLLTKSIVTKIPKKTQIQGINHDIPSKKPTMHEHNS